MSVVIFINCFACGEIGGTWKKKIKNSSFTIFSKFKTPRSDIEHIKDLTQEFPSFLGKIRIFRKIQNIYNWLKQELKILRLEKNIWCILSPIIVTNYFECEKWWNSREKLNVLYFVFFCIKNRINKLQTEKNCIIYVGPYCLFPRLVFLV